MGKADSVVEYPLKHLRVLGPPGSGKSALLIERYRHLVRTLPGGPKCVCVITYSRERSRQLTEALLTPDAGGLGDLPVLTYNDLASRVIEAIHGRSPRLLVEAEERILLDRLIHDHELHLKTGSSHFRRTERFQEAMRAGIRSLLQHGADLEALGALRSLDGVADALHDLFLLCEQFRTFLHAHRYETFYTVGWEAARTASRIATDHPLHKADLLIIEDFQDIDPGQFEMLRALYPPGCNTKINVFGDPTGARFTYRGTHHRFLMEDFPTLYAPETLDLPAGASNVAVLGPVYKRLLEETRGEEAARHLPVMDGTTGGLKSGGADIRLYVGENECDEVRTVAAWAKYLIEQQGMPPQAIAVTTKNKKIYEPLLSAAFRQQGIPLETGQASDSMMRSFLVLLLRVLLGPDAGTSHTSLLTSPHHRTLENILRARWHQAGTVHGETQKLGDLITVLLRDWSGDSAMTKVGKVFDEIIIPLIRETGDDRTASFALNLREQWKRHVDFSSRLGGTPDVAAFLRTNPVLQEEAGASKPTAGRVGYYSCHEVHHYTFSALCLIGCSETLFPAPQAKDTVIPYEELKSAVERIHPGNPFDSVHLKTAEEHLRDEYGLLYLALTRGETVLLVTAPEKFAGEEYPAPSDILSQTLEAASPEIELGRVDPPLYRIADGALRGKPNERDMAERRLADTLPMIPLWWREPCERVEFSLDPAALSESSLNTYIDCERLYFYRKVLRIPEPEMAYFTLGNLLHGSLEKLCKESASVTELLERSAPGRVQALIDTILVEMEDAPAGSLFERMLRRLLEKLIADFYTIERDREGEYDIGSLEETFEYAYGGYTFRGRIDRMDRIGEHLLLIDYKTGMPVTTGGGMRKRVTECGENLKNQNWQIPIYSWWLKKEKGRLPLAFYHYLLRPEEEPRLIALYLFEREAEWEAFLAEKGKNRYASYLLEDEIEACMTLAVGIAERLFAPRSSFSKSEEESGCFMCPFKGFCKRDGRESE